jgi:PhzF family phenazine biosynthesis protein
VHGDLLVQVDAFTTGAPFSGNPAAVALLESGRDDEWKQGLARELGLSETAFPHARADGSFDLRWFTPTTEIELCGHATLATAHVLWSRDMVQADADITFHTRGGVLVVRRRADRGIELDFPAIRATTASLPHVLANHLGLLAADIVHSGTTPSKYRLIVLRDAATVRRLTPDFGSLRTDEPSGFIVTAESDDHAHDIVSRYFVPAYGIDEDPATGAAHCVLTPYWTKRLGRNPLRCYQASARGAELECELAGDRVLLRGTATTVYEAELRV